MSTAHDSLLRSVGSFVEINAAITDSQRLDWLERNLMSISHDRATCSVDMSGVRVRGQLYNEARGANAGSSHFRVNHRSIREAVDAAMQWPNEPKPSGFEECASKSPKGSAAHRHSESGNVPVSDAELAEARALLGLLADIRAAVGDPTGRLMQDELVERCRKLRADNELLRAAKEGS